MGTSLRSVRCPWCLADDDRVVDSRVAEDGAAIRRRRECSGCGHRYTTFERIDEIPLIVVKRSGIRQPFDRGKLIDGLRAATKNRPVTEDQLEVVAREVEDELREEGWEATSEQVGLAVLEHLRSSTRWPTSGSPASTRGSRASTTSDARWACSTKTTAPKRPEA